MPTARASRKISASPEDLWEIVRDPYHLPRWWPRVARVEDVADDAFTEVMKTRKGKTVRADFDVIRSDEQSRTLVWEQRVEGTPFAGVLSSSETELRVAPAGEQPPGAEVTIEMRQELSNRAGSTFRGKSLLPSMGQRMVRRAALKVIEEALTGLEQISV
jgi:uncharacterized protein YndB with AHSA1/START domain